MDCILEILFPNCDKNVLLYAFAQSLVSREPHGKYFRWIKYSKLQKNIPEKKPQKIKLGVEGHVGHLKQGNN